MNTTKDDELVALLTKAPDDELIFLLTYICVEIHLLELGDVPSEDEFTEFIINNSFSEARLFLIRKLRKNDFIFSNHKNILKFKIKKYKTYIQKIKYNEIPIYNLIQRINNKNPNQEVVNKIFLISLSKMIISEKESIIINNIKTIHSLKTSINKDLKSYINNKEFISWMGENTLKSRKSNTHKIIGITRPLLEGVDIDLISIKYKYIVHDRSSLISYLSIKRLEDFDEYNKYIHRVKKAWQQKNYLASKAKDNHIKLNKKTMDNLEKLSSLKGTKKELLLSEIIKLELEKVEEENKAKA
ncbi:hypothetical protein OZX61_08885 [Acinetobacter sp. ESL0695]|uniref:hypothetical protein n=1 Tax=Acinetobacter sp. ESL0695 TaxID=2983215 RepID=UPI0023EF6928|nr:hypothetical protein [Acinetobacter sp. ESL0695]WEV48388.1 hypothetical protein OZX61_08885 [Acinetobacter sp. ESL0695]